MRVRFTEWYVCFGFGYGIFNTCDWCLGFTDSVIFFFGLVKVLDFKVLMVDSFYFTFVWLFVFFIKHKNLKIIWVISNYIFEQLQINHPSQQICFTQEGRGNMTVNCTGNQSFIPLISFSLAQNFTFIEFWFFNYELVVSKLLNY